MGDVGMSGAAACAGAAALWLLSGRNAGVRRARLLLAGGGAVGAGPPDWRAVAVGRVR
ncbi:tight adherence protein B, partial [Streptomyces sp. DI166]